VVLTGGSGRLGRELQVEMLRLSVGELLAPTRAQLDITDRAGVSAYVRALRPRLIVHAAAFTDVAGAEQHRQACWSANVEGTRNLVAAAREAQARLVLISTDYVFYGDQEVGEGHGSGYREEDTPGPVRNYYALTKLVAEEAARSYAGALVLRTSFRPREWPYRNAFDDLFTSQDYVDVIAPLVAETVFRHDRGEVPYDTLHVATERKSVYELARRRAPDVTRASRLSANVELPADVSLNTERWQDLLRRWAEAQGA
jgi:dTDP-4-dehydrorhamnose reductase